ncbi:coiled-coil domain-containing protein 34 isoform X2 [Patella vulgata]|uniref:coiled-coil domain-containing protein 34 isoform X2 n=1 Tax=Patella vulgata TaxID=6465 RepID=UPI0024A855BA|nr:coiled-coil domain-containing protein 34 isoform X2 [Patella vulgata]
MDDYYLTSSRPRPVTATVTKPKWMEPPCNSTHRHSLDSTGSTASLTSVLDHDSYISDYTDDDDIHHTFNDMKIEEGPLDSTYNKTADDKTDDTCNYTTDDQLSYSPYERSKSKSPRTPIRKQRKMEDEFQGLSPWERWLLIKTREERIKKKFELRNKRAKEEEEKKKEEKKMEKIGRTEEEIEKWEEKKIEKIKQQKRLEKEAKELEKSKEEEKKMEILEKSSQKYKEWMKAKKQAELSKRREEKEKLKREKEEEEARKLKAEQKYKEWVEKAKQRPMSASINCSRNSSSNRLTDQPDFGAYPEPTFCNPIPWQPIKIPAPKSASKANVNKSKVKKPKGKYVWNPEKYF